MTRYLKYVHGPSHSTLVPKVKTIYINNVDKTLDCLQQKPLHQSHLISELYLYLYSLGKQDFIYPYHLDRQDSNVVMVFDSQPEGGPMDPHPSVRDRETIISP